VKYGFIGAGNMAGSFVSGMIAGGTEPQSIVICEKNEARSGEVRAKLGVASAGSPEELVKLCDIVFLVVKPDQMEDPLKRIRKAVAEHSPLVVSVAAGKTLEYVGSFLDDAARVARVMPNVNAGIRRSVTAYCCNANVTQTDCEELLKCLSAIGSFIALEEKLFPIFTAIASCGPAFAYIFIDALATAAVKHGMNKKDALEAAALTVLGSAASVAESGLHPRVLADMVCSPSGATIEGVCELAGSGFEAAVISAVSAAYHKTKDLGGAALQPL